MMSLCKVCRCALPPGRQDLVCAWCRIRAALGGDS